MNKFMEAKEKERKNNELMRKDKHLLPVDKFYDNKTGRQVKDDFDKLPFSSVDIIFNHKNVWANLQNPNPAKIMFNIHDNK